MSLCLNLNLDPNVKLNGDLYRFLKWFPRVVTKKELQSGSSGSSRDCTKSIVPTLIPAFLFQVALSVQSQGQQATWERIRFGCTKRKETG